MISGNPFLIRKLSSFAHYHRSAKRFIYSSPVWSPTPVELLPSSVLHVIDGNIQPQYIDGELLPPKSPGAIRIVCISDTHAQHEGMYLPSGDLLIHAGDILTESGERDVSIQRSDERLWESIQASDSDRATNSNYKGCKVKVKNSGISLLANFAKWFGSRPHTHKLVIGGNHDLVLQALGSDHVRTLFNRYGGPNSNIMYLEHESARLGPLKVFGTARGNWPSRNNAFQIAGTTQHTNVCGNKLSFSLDSNTLLDGTHLFVSHMPCIVPNKNGELREDETITKALARAQVQLAIMGHCHWAHGVYRTHSGIPCVIASVCDHEWLYPDATTGSNALNNNNNNTTKANNNHNNDTLTSGNFLPGPSGRRLDHLRDLTQGGYNRRYAPIVCDIHITPNQDEIDEDEMEYGAGRRWTVPSKTDKWILINSLSSIQPQPLSSNTNKLTIDSINPSNTNITPIEIEHEDPSVYPSEEYLSSTNSDADESYRPSLLFFGAPTDPGSVRRLFPTLNSLFAVHLFDSAADAVQDIYSPASIPYVACVAKLGSFGNLGLDVLTAIRNRWGIKPLLIVHSVDSTGPENTALRSEMESKLGGEVLFVDSASEDIMINALKTLLPSHQSEGGVNN